MQVAKEFFKALASFHPTTPNANERTHVTVQRTSLTLAAMKMGRWFVTRDAPRLARCTKECAHLRLL